MSFTETTTLSRRKVLLGLGFLSAAGVAFAREPDEKLDYLGKGNLEDLVPKQIGNWDFVTTSGLVVPPEDQLSQATYSQLLTRTYSDGAGPPMMLLVAQSAQQTGILQIHRPEICYTAGGYQLAEPELSPIRLPDRNLPAIHLAASADGRTEQVLYWTRIGERLPTSWREQKIAVALANFKGVNPDAVMVRVSTFGNDPRAAKTAMETFVRLLLQSLTPAQRRVLIG
jgi:EpsI family protein